MISLSANSASGRASAITTMARARRGQRLAAVSAPRPATAKTTGVDPRNEIFRTMVLASGVRSDTSHRVMGSSQGRTLNRAPAASSRKRPSAAGSSQGCRRATRDSDIGGSRWRSTDDRLGVGRGAATVREAGTAPPSHGGRSCGNGSIDPRSTARGCHGPPEGTLNEGWRGGEDRPNCRLLTLEARSSLAAADPRRRGNGANDSDGALHRPGRLDRAVGGPR